ncbi:hypothetical protein FRC12_001720 [Ceratobasidium sp. 428]|nr:hypothetical protein FRC12_001720 [Ceratobasidium sp. 428]
MLPGLAITSWLLVTTVSGAALPNPTIGVRVINDRAEYWKHAATGGMCLPKLDKEVNLKRVLTVPGEGILADFNVCAAKNEFGEVLHDTSGQIFCHGQAIHLMADAMNHEDSKTFVDRATELSAGDFNTFLQGFFNTTRENEFTVESFLKQVEGKFKPAGEELSDYQNSRFPGTPDFIHQIRPQARLLRAWSKIVHHYWDILDRDMTQMHHDYLIPGPGSVPEEETEKYSTSLIRLDHPFVVAGGRFREQYYWDSFFIMEGLLAANVTYLARTTLLNFMDEIKAYGFIPNGGRSQPPMFISMLHAYMHATDDKQILHDALPLAERELRWWQNNRNVSVTDRRGATHQVFQYNVKATGPRPESYAEDWRSVWCNPEAAPTKQDERDFYSEFASGAETGWDYTARWMSNPFAQAGRDKLLQMRDLRVRNIVPVDLNSILYRSHRLMAHMYELASTNESPFAMEYSRRHQAKADRLREAILALHWDPDNLAFFDFVLDEKPAETPTKKPISGKIHRFWSGASVVPYWAEIWPMEFGNCTTQPQKQAVMQAFSGIRDILNRYPGPLPSSLVETDQQWDFPNSWPPLQYFAIKALENIDLSCIDDTSVVDFNATKRPEHQLGDATLLKLPEAIPGTPQVDYTTSPSWRDVLTKTVAMRYMNAAYCTWNETGKFPPDRVEIVVRDDPRLDSRLATHPGNMYEKLSAKSATKSGSGGEYHVQTGFGWTNGVAIWIAKHFGAILDNPKCHNVSQSEPTPGSDSDLGWKESVLFQN